MRLMKYVFAVLVVGILGCGPGGYTEREAAPGPADPNAAMQQMSAGPQAKSGPLGAAAAKKAPATTETKE